MEERELYAIGEAAAVTGISAKTLRYYDSLGLVVPEQRKQQNNYRYYSKSQIVTLHMIRRLRLMGCDLKSIHAIVKQNDLNTLYSHVQIRIQELNREIEEREAILSSTKEFIDRLEKAVKLQEENSKEAFDTYLLKNASVEEIPKVWLFSERRLMHNYNINDTSVNFWLELYESCKKNGLNIIGSGIITYHTDLLGQFIMQDCDMQIGIKVEKVMNCKQVSEFGGFTAATAIHIGSYSKMINTYLMLLQWINRNGYEVDGKISEEAIISPVDALDPKDQIIKVIVPIKKHRLDKGFQEV